MGSGRDLFEGLLTTFVHFSPLMPSLLSTSSPPAHPIFRCFLFAGHLKTIAECTNGGNVMARRRFIQPGNAVGAIAGIIIGPGKPIVVSSWRRRRGYSPSTPWIQAFSSQSWSSASRSWNRSVYTDWLSRWRSLDDRCAR